MLGHSGALWTLEGVLLLGLAKIPFRDSNMLFICKPTDPEPVIPATFAVGLPHSGSLSTHPNHWTARFSSVAQSCPTLWDPMDCSTPGLPVHHQLLEFSHTHIRWVDDAIQPSHPLSPSVTHFFSCLQSFPASGSFPVSQFFSSSGQSIGVSASASVLPTNIQERFH